MNNYECANSAREQNRKNFSTSFLWDLCIIQIDDENDPRNKIGLNCGINKPRAFEIFGRNMESMSAL